MELPRQAIPSEVVLTKADVTIIGGGLSGTLVAIQLLKQAQHKLNLCLIESQSSVGPGLAYSTAEPNHLLNVPAAKMSAFPDQPDHFLKWLQNYLQKNPELAEAFWLTPDLGQAFAPRQLYGIYLQAILQEALAIAADHNGTKLEYICDEAVALHLRSGEMLVELQSGKQLSTAKIVLALGNFAPTNPPVADPSFYSSPRYKPSPWSSAALEGLASDEPIMLIGTGLTMVDVTLALKNRGHRGQIYAVSRHGLLSQVHAPAKAVAGLELAELLSTSEPLKVRNLLRYLRAKVRLAEESGSNWRVVIDGLRPFLPQLWQRLSTEEKQRFLRHAKPFWEVHRHRLPPQLKDFLLKLQNEGQLLVKAAYIQGFCEQPDGVEVTLKPRHKNQTAVIKVGRVINCTGPNMDFSRVNSPLLQNLLAQGLATPDPLGLGLVVAETGLLVSNNTTNPESPLYTLGSVCKGSRWETTAVPEIRVQAQTLAHQLLRDSQD